MDPILCPFLHRNGEFSSSCAVSSYIGLLAPAAACVASSVIFCLSFTSEPWHQHMPPRSCEGPTRDENEELDILLAGLRRDQYVAVIPPLVGLLELVVVLADIALSTVLVFRETHWPDYVCLLSSIYLFILVVARKCSTELHARLQRHSAVLYGIIWLSVIGRLYALSPAQPRDFKCDVLIARLVLLTGLCLIHITAPREPIYAHSSRRRPTTPPGPDETASLLSRLTFTWINKLIWKAYRASLETSDLYPVNHHCKAAAVIPTFIAMKGDGEKLLWRMFSFSRKDLLRQGAWDAVAGVGVFVPAVLIRRILEYLESSRSTQHTSPWLFVLGLLASGLITGVAGCQTDWIGQNITANIRTALISQIYAKILQKRIGKPAQSGDRCDPDAETNAEDDASDGAILNLLSVDANAISFMSGNLQLVWVTFPVQTTIGTYLLYSLLGVSGLLGVLLMVLLLPLNSWLSRQLGTAKGRVLLARDSRIQEANELLQNIRTIKLMAWEAQFKARVLERRDAEIKRMRTNFIWWSINMTLFHSFPFLVTIFTLSFYTIVFGNSLGTTVAFPALVIFSVIRIPLDRLSDSIVFLIQAHVSLVRIEKFFKEQETGNYAQLSHNGPGAVGFRDATLTWPTGKDHAVSVQPDPETSLSPPFMLKGLDITFPKGALSIICGASGSGKSALLLSLLGEMNLVSGQVYISPGEIGSETFDSAEPEVHPPQSVAYCPQEAWIMNQTIRDNILMMLPLDNRRYEQVLRSVALDQDIATLVHGDQTLAGENGSRLSGGQKQRVALARALYSTANCVLLDDCLSAVDSRTASHIFFHAIKGPLMHGRTCILSTHHTQLVLPHADFSVFLEGGCVKRQGNPQELETADLIDISSNDDNPDTPETSGSAETQPRPLPAGATTPPRTVPDIESTGGDELSDGKKPQPAYQEKKSEGAVSWSNIFGYLRAAGNPIYWLIVLAGFAAQQLVALGTNLWIKEWAFQNDRLRSGTEDPKLSSGYYLAIYVGICGSYALITFLRDLVTFHGSLKASSRIYRQLLDAVLHAKLAFFDSVPLGQITNRFSQDVEVLDESLAPFCVSALQVGATLLMIAILISVVLPAFLAVALAIGLVSYLVMVVYLNGARDLKRLFAAARSPLLQQVGESLAGFVSIRAYGLTAAFMTENGKLLDGLTQPFLLLAANKQWLTFNVNALSSIISFFTGAFVVWKAGSMDPGAAGLVLAYAASFTENVMWFVQIYSIVQQNLTSIERIVEYTETEQEAKGPLRQPNHSVPQGWPLHGNIRFHEYSTRYSPELEQALKGISFEAKAGKRVAIVGRTGAGKSTLALALIRAIEADSGRIEIDGIDISAVPLHQLRQAVTVVPQDPKLFSGSVRTNLDPLSRYSDDDVLNALRALGAEVHLGTDLERPASVLSQGQRQMLCIARGLLRRSKVVVLDEATASIDHATDTAIQAGMRASLATGTTVITIAHRLRTIADYDMVIVLKAGQIVEQGSVRELLENHGEDAIFRRMCEESGDIAAIEQAANATRGRVE